ncbi:MAG: ABC transporter substrate-binding protein [Acidimicrobiia bacterium]|nr:ABC transporter substrate-binding protein [Acidimicrobiia bacterium]
MRIASLLPGATETLFAIGKGPDVVGRTHKCDHPPEARGLPTLTHDLLPQGISSAAIHQATQTSLTDAHTVYEVDAHALRSVEPDVVVTQRLCSGCVTGATPAPEATCDMPRSARLISSDPTTLNGVMVGMVDLGEAVGAEPEARTFVSLMQARLDEVASLVDDRDAPRTAVLQWADPVCAPGHWVPDMVEAAGGTNVIGLSGKPSQAIDMDEVAEARPEVIVLAFDGFDLYETQARYRELHSQPGWPRLAGSAQVFAVDASVHTSRPGPRLVDGVELLAWALHRPDSSLRPAVGRGAHLIEAGWVDVASLPVGQPARN